MKRLLPVMAVLGAIAVAGSSGPAFAQTGINLAWNDCSSAGVVDKTFACTANTGTDFLFGSFYTPTELTRFISIEAVIDAISSTSTLPAWFNFKNTAPAGCHSGGLSATGDFSTNTACDNTCWVTIPSGGPAFQYPFPTNSSQSVSSQADSLRHERIKVVLAMPAGTEGTVSPNIEYYAFRVGISHTKTVGTGACAGCLEPICLVLNQIRIVQPFGSPGGNIDVTTSAANRICTWQGGPGQPTCDLVPTRRTTWGQIKGLYR